MSKKMLIDATHPEETRVAVTEGNRLEEFDYESTFRKALKGSIFLAKVTRVEPSLQAAFVNFGGNRHGFLPFSEIHPDYFRIPIADREALMAEQDELLKEMDAEAEAEDADEVLGPNDDGSADDDDDVVEDAQDEDVSDNVDETDEVDANDPNGNVKLPDPEDELSDEELDAEAEAALKSGDVTPEGEANNNKNQRGRGGRGRGGRGRGRGGRGGQGRGNAQNRSQRSEKYDNMDDEQRFRFKMRRKYKIQEVIKRGQIMLVQVSKEERGNKGAAVGSYLSLPGRYCVLMPNSPRAGGVSRKISNYKDRAKMREMMKELEVPKGMSVILRTAGVTRTKAEVKRDLEYLMRLWDSIRELTLESSAPAAVYEEANLVKRAVRDLYTRDVEEIVVAGDKGYKTAKEFMKMMIPSHVKRVKEFKEPNASLFQHYKIEGQIAEIGETEVTLKSGGYLVINPTEALVSVDVNSGKATKGRHIEETALKTNLEAADEVARQLRLRDLGGLVVIDFIDMEDRRNNGKVERRMRDALAGDRARIQVGRISSFGLMEMSRQRMNPSLTESQFETCPNCSGVGRVRTADAASIMLLRAIEEEAVKGRAAQIIVHVANSVALYVLNHKRDHLSEIEARYNMNVLIRADDDLGGSGFRIEVSKPADKGGADEDAEKDNNSKAASKDASGDDEGRSRRRGRRGGRRRNGRRDENEANEANEANETSDVAADRNNTESSDKAQDAAEGGDASKDEKPASRGRGRKKKDDAPQADEASVEATKAPEADAAKEEKPKKPARGRKKKTEGEDAEVKADDAEAEKPKKAAAKAKKSSAASNDDAPKVEEKEKPLKKSVAKKKAEPKEDVPKDYETVNEAPKKKKKGWWIK